MPLASIPNLPGHLGALQVKLDISTLLCVLIVSPGSPAGSGDVQGDARSLLRVGSIQHRWF